MKLKVKSNVVSSVVSSTILCYFKLFFIAKKKAAQHGLNWLAVRLLGGDEGI